MRGAIARSPRALFLGCDYANSLCDIMLAMKTSIARVVFHVKQARDSGSTGSGSRGSRSAGPWEPVAATGTGHGTESTLERLPFRHRRVCGLECGGGARADSGLAWWASVTSHVASDCQRGDMTSSMPAHASPAGLPTLSLVYLTGLSKEEPYDRACARHRSPVQDWMPFRTIRGRQRCDPARAGAVPGSFACPPPRAHREACFT